MTRPTPPSLMRMRARGQRGASLVESLIVVPTFLFVALGLIQAALVYYAKSNVNYATHEAARAGSVDHASVGSIVQGFQRAMVPYYGGGRTPAELKAVLDKIVADPEMLAMRVEILSPTQESFQDYNSPKLQTQYGTSEQVLPNVGLDQLSCPRDVPGCKSDPKTNASGQSLLDANLLKLRITYGVPKAKQVPLVGPFYTWALNQMGMAGTDAFMQGLIANGQIPVVTTTVLRMQSDPIRNSLMASSPGPGNDGHPTDPGDPPPDNPLPTCGFNDPGCTTPPTPGSGGGGGGGGSCPAVPFSETLSADVLFDFDKSTLSAAGTSTLDSLITEAKTRSFDSLTIAGYADPLGTEAHNLTLSLARANAVRDYLKAHGFPAKPIVTEGKGSANPIKTLADCPAGPSQISCLAPDRRVTFSFN